jgi:CheY-like chemotaxis protein
VLTGLHVLVADDSSLARVLVSAAVRASRVPIAGLVTVNDGAEALHALWKQRTDLLVTDIQMPRIDGFELIARIAQSPDLDHVRVVTLSSAATRRRDVRSAGARVHTHLDKPLRFELLGAVLSDIWREVQAEGR